jgi:hypothetical protein
MHTARVLLQQQFAEICLGQAFGVGLGNFFVDSYNAFDLVRHFELLPAPGFFVWPALQQERMGVKCQSSTAKCPPGVGTSGASERTCGERTSMKVLPGDTPCIVGGPGGAVLLADGR